MTDFFLSLADGGMSCTHTQFEVSSQMWSVQSLQPGDTLFSLFIPLFNCLCRCPLKLFYPFLLLFFLLDFISFSGSRVEVSLRSEYVKLRWAWITTAGLPGIVWWPNRVEFWVCFLNCFFLSFSLHWSRETDVHSFFPACHCRVVTQFQFNHLPGRMRDCPVSVCSACSCVFTFSLISLYWLCDLSFPLQRNLTLFLF